MLNPLKDRWSWDLNGSGEFSVASARRYIDNNRLPDISFKTRWIKQVPIKVNVHAWWNISRRGIDIPSILCPLCETGVESSKHLFFNCSVVRAIFRKVCIWWDASYMALDSFDEWIFWITNLRLHSKHKSILEGVCYGLWWFIWAFQNKKIFGVVPSSKVMVTKGRKSVGKEKQKSVGKRKEKVSESEAALGKNNKAMKNGKWVMVEDDVDFNKKKHVLPRGKKNMAMEKRKGIMVEDDVDCNKKKHVLQSPTSIVIKEGGSLNVVARSISLLNVRERAGGIDNVGGNKAVRSKYVVLGLRAREDLDQQPLPLPTEIGQLS
nr:RNA-directed DNA polymerase, eukaryota [Tanacetum cinerariifolium]